MTSGNHDDPLEARLRKLRPSAASSDLASRISEQLADSATVDRPTQRKVWRSTIPWATAACLLVGLSTWLIFSDNQSGVTLARSWRLTSRGEVQYELITPTHLLLTRGELHFAASGVESPIEALTIETPYGNAQTTDAEFYVGVHGPATDLDTPPISQEKKVDSMNSVTRVLVLTGAVTLTSTLGSAVGHANDLVSASPSQEPTNWAIEANSNFALEYYKQLAKEHEGENLFFSPYSIGSVLVMAAEGARGQTADEIGRVLCFPEAARRVGDDAQLIPWRASLIGAGMTNLNRRLQTQPADKAQELREKIARLRGKLKEAEKKQYELRVQFRREKHELKLDAQDMTVQWDDVQAAFQEEQRLTGQIEKLLTQVDPFQLHIASSLWGEQSYPFKASYLETIDKDFGAGEVVAADFKNNPARELQRINSWVAERTQDRIPNLLPEGSIDPLTRMVLINAIYFKGEWLSPFHVSQTKPRDFVASDGNVVRTSIMKNRFDSLNYGAFQADGSFFKTPNFVDQGPGYPSEAGFSMVELPYKGDTLSMVLIAPNRAEGMASLEEKMTAQNVSKWIAQCQLRKTDVLMPKFNMSTKYFLRPTLEAMGMPSAFDTRTANFQGMTDSADPEKQLYLSAAVHQTFLEVNEKGTEAVAATGAAVAKMAIRRDPFIPKFAADRPFIFLIRDTHSGHILFMGRMMKPEST